MILCYRMIKPYFLLCFTFSLSGSPIFLYFEKYPVPFRKTLRCILQTHKLCSSKVININIIKMASNKKLNILPSEINENKD